MKTHWKIPYLFAASLLVSGAFLVSGSLYGQDWQHLQGGRVLDVFTTDGLSAWTAEDGGRIRHTADGGQNWTFQTTPDDVRRSLRGLFFLDQQIGWAVGDGGVVLGTIDGGEHWEQLNAAPILDLLGEPAMLHGVHFVNPSRGWVVGADETLVSTHDGGATWSWDLPIPEHNYTYDNTPPDYYAVTFLDDLTGFVVGQKARLLHTFDGGLTWDRADLVGVPEFVYLWDIEFTGWRGVAVGGAGNQEGWRLVTLDGGRTWQRDGCSLGFGAVTTSQYGLALFDGTGGGLSCGYGSQILAKTIPGEPCWQGSSLFSGQGNATVPLRAADGTEGGIAWVTGEFGTIRRTTDQGLHWENQGSDVALRPGTIHFVDTLRGFVGGEHQHIVKTVDGGQSWTSVFHGPSANRFTGLAFDQAGRHGVAVGGHTSTLAGPQSLAVFSETGGNSWYPATLPAGMPAVDFNDVTISADGTAWAVGAHGVILRSDDGGKTWVDGSSPYVADTLYSVAFGIDPAEGFIVGRQGAWRTINAGERWDPIPVDAGAGIGWLRDVDVHRVRDAWAVGDGGEVYRFDPVNKAFRRVDLSIPFNVSLSSVAVVPSNDTTTQLEVFAAGAGGTVLWFDGSHWSLPKSSTSLGITDLSFVSADLGFSIANQAFAIQTYR